MKKTIKIFVTLMVVIISIGCDTLVEPQLSPVEEIKNFVEIEIVFDPFCKIHSDCIIYQDGIAIDTIKEVSLGDVDTLLLEYPIDSITIKWDEDDLISFDCTMYPDTSRLLWVDKSMPYVHYSNKLKD